MSEPTSTTTEVEDPNLVTLTLAHPVSKAMATQVDAKVKTDYKVGAEITVSREWGRGLIDAGYVAYVEPNDQAAIRKALRLDNRDRPLEVTQEGQGTAEGAGNEVTTEKVADSGNDSGGAAAGSRSSGKAKPSSSGS